MPIRGKGRKRRPLTLFSASFPHPVQGVSPAALNALAAAPGRQVYRHLGFSARITPRYFVERLVHELKLKYLRYFPHWRPRALSSAGPSRHGTKEKSYHLHCCQQLLFGYTCSLLSRQCGMKYTKDCVVFHLFVSSQ